MTDTYLAAGKLVLDGQEYSSLTLSLGFKIKNSYTFTGASFTIPNFNSNEHYLVVNNNSIVKDYTLSEQGIITVSTSGTYYVYNFTSNEFSIEEI